MLNADQPFASAFLWLASFSFLLVYGLPLTLVPVRWARWFQWSLPEDLNAPQNVHLHQLAEYFGRCTGTLAITITLFAMRAAGDPAAHPYVLEIIFIACLGMTLVHAYGALRRIQPWTENAEILLYAAMTGLAAGAWGTLP
ncbi:MAG: hypothetical protein RIT28_2819 [Pseudomonadota bacterium]